MLQKYVGMVLILLILRLRQGHYCYFSKNAFFGDKIPDDGEPVFFVRRV